MSETLQPVEMQKNQEEEKFLINEFSAWLEILTPEKKLKIYHDFQDFKDLDYLIDGLGELYFEFGTKEKNIKNIGLLVTEFAKYLDEHQIIRNKLRDKFIDNLNNNQSENNNQVDSETPHWLKRQNEIYSKEHGVPQPQLAPQNKKQPRKTIVSDVR